MVTVVNDSGLPVKAIEERDARGNVYLRLVMEGSDREAAPMTAEAVERLFPGLIKAIMKAVIAELANDGGLIHKAVQRVERRNIDNLLAAIQSVTLNAESGIWNHSAPRS
jgi:hypothetical protein